MKLLSEFARDNDWGMKPGEEGTLAVNNEDYIPVAEDGTYAINVNFNTMSYELIRQ